MATVSDLIHSSMRLIGQIASGEILETDELNDAFTLLNRMVASWNTEGASLPGRVRQTVALTTPTATYTLATRPIKIESASVSAGGVDHPLEIVDSAGWEQITEKGALAIMARKLFCDYAYPTSAVYIWPAPRTSGTLELWVFAPITAFGSTGATIDLPPGYEIGLQFNLAMNLAFEYGRTVDPALAASAQNFKASLVQLNASNHMRTPLPAPNPLPSQTGVAS